MHPEAPSERRLDEWLKPMRQGAALERQAIPDQMRAERGQQPVGDRGFNGCIDKPGKGRRKLHGAIVGLTDRPCHELFPTSGFSAAISQLSLGGIDD